MIWKAVIFLVVKINVKQLGSKRNRIDNEDFVLVKTPSNVKELICEAVHTCVSEYNLRVKKGENADVLSEDMIEKMSGIGKIAFGINYGGREADEENAVKTAIEAYEDGLFRIFINENEAGALYDSINISEGESLTFIKMTMLSGRMF